MYPFTQSTRRLIDKEYYRKIWKTDEATTAFRIPVKKSGDNTRSPEITSDSSTNCNSTTKPYLRKLGICTYILDIIKHIGDY